MKKLNFISVLLLMLVIFVSTSSSTFAANWKNVTFVNHTGRTIYRLYFTGSGEGSWGKDWLGSSLLKSGESISLKYNANNDLFDYKIVFDNNGNDFYTWRQRSFSGVWRITIYKDGDGDYSAVKN